MTLQYTNLLLLQDADRVANQYESSLTLVRPYSLGSLVSCPQILSSPILTSELPFWIHQPPNTGLKMTE